MWHFFFTKESYKLFAKLEPGVYDRIQRKIKWLKKHPDPRSVLYPLEGYEPASYKLRVGNYRLILHHMSKREFVIVDIGHRREIYK